MKWTSIILVLGLLLVMSSTGLALRDAPAPWLQSLCEGVSMPTSGFIYWTNSGTPDIIERSNLDGSDRETVISGLQAPRDVALDVMRNKMYWTDNRTAMVELKCGAGLEKRVCFVYPLLI